jgi:hypothetical protein
MAQKRSFKVRDDGHHVQEAEEIHPVLLVLVGAGLGLVIGILGMLLLFTVWS